MFEKYLNKIRKKLGLKISYPSETSKVRQLVLEYCSGYGCDIGFGGDKIKKEAIGIDFANPYADTGKDKVDIACDVINEELPIVDNKFDYVYSSHLIEDFEDTVSGLKKFTRILKSGGVLILVFPDQKKYEQFCKKTGQPLNMYHKHADMGYRLMLEKLSEIKTFAYQLLFKSDCEIDYNVVMVLKILKNGENKEI